MEYKNISGNLKKSLQRDWIITNGIGGFCSQSELGVNTRRYHGLLIAPLNPPAKRHLILSKVDESIEINNKKYDLFSNIANGDITEGYKYLVDFKKEYIPIYTYQVENTNIKKFICMEYGKNTVVVLYRIKNGPDEAKFCIAPIVNFRDFHSLNKDHHFEAKQTHKGNKLEVTLDGNTSTPIYMYCNEGKYLKHNEDMFYNMYYPREEERGFDSVENHYVPGVYNINIAPNEEKIITFVCSLEENIEEIDGIKVINNEVMRLSELIYDTELIQNRKMNDKNIDMIKSLIIASDNFVVNRPTFGLHTLIAGYPWFLDWGRDSLIAFEGLLLVTKRYEIAREVLLTNIRDLKFGIVPNGYDENNNKPLYNSADSALLLIEEVYKYAKYTNDFNFVKEKMYEPMKKIISAYINGTNLDDNNIFLDDDNLVSAGSFNTQITWMDAKVNGTPVTPRNGKTVELNALWFNALKIMARFAERFGEKEKCKEYLSLAEATKASFIEKFYNEQKKCLYDVLGDPKVRPNQLFALSLTHPIIEDKKIAKETLKTIKEKLLNPYGLKTLAADEEKYVDIYEGSPAKRDSSYHQGITWVWLLGLYYEAIKNYMKIDKKDNENAQKELKELIERTTETFKEEMKMNSSIGTISEIYDSRFPFEARGAFAQAWSVAEVLRIVLEK